MTTALSVVVWRKLIDRDTISVTLAGFNAFRGTKGKKPVKINTVTRYASGYEKGLPSLARAYIRTRI